MYEVRSSTAKFTYFARLAEPIKIDSLIIMYIIHS